ncbi:MAG: hypothetical protein JST00_35320 [Deltaproteobacteria bacterium]|nr:hypothetical protein [Deltaproteobacteria bacterium]
MTDAAATGHGELALGFNREDGGTLALFAFARFYAQPRPKCTLEIQQGGCRLRKCPLLPIETPRSSAGRIDVTTDGLSLALIPEASGYRVTNAGGIQAPSDALVRITAEGAIVPQFESSVRIPAQVTVTSPQKPDGGKLRLSRSSPFPVTWMAPSDGAVVVRYEIVDETLGAPKGEYVECAFEARMGAGTVPASLITQLGGTGGFIQVHTERTTAVTPLDSTNGLWDVQVLARVVGTLNIGGGGALYEFAYEP